MFCCALSLYKITLLWSVTTWSIICYIGAGMSDCFAASVSSVVPPLRQYRLAQIPGARSSWRLNFIRWRLIFVGPQYGTCLILPFWPAESRGRFQIFGKLLHLCVRIHGVVFQKIVVLIRTAATASDLTLVLCSFFDARTQDLHPHNM